MQYFENFGGEMPQMPPLVARLTRRNYVDEKILTLTI